MNYLAGTVLSLNELRLSLKEWQRHYYYNMIRRKSVRLIDRMASERIHRDGELTADARA